MPHWSDIALFKLSLPVNDLPSMDNYYCFQGEKYVISLVPMKLHVLLPTHKGVSALEITCFTHGFTGLTSRDAHRAMFPSLRQENFYSQRGEARDQSQVNMCQTRASGEKVTK